MNKQTVERWIWPLIFGGLILLALGLAVRPSDGAIGWTMVVVGGLVAAAGAVLIAVRSRMTP